MLYSRAMEHGWTRGCAGSARARGARRAPDTPWLPNPGRHTAAATRPPPAAGGRPARPRRRRPRRAGRSRRSARCQASASRRHPPAGPDRRAEVEGPAPPAPPAAPGGAHRMAGRQGRPALPAHRSVQDRFRGGDQGDVQRLRHALPHPAGGGHAQGSGDRDLRAVRARVGERARADPAAADPPRAGQPAGHRHLPGRVLQPGPLHQERLAADPGEPERDRQLRAAGRAGALRQARRQRPPHRPDRRLAAAVRLRAARQRHPRGAAPRLRQRALPHRRRPAPGLPDSRAGALGHDQPHQDPRTHGRGGEAPPAGRPHQDPHARTATKSSCACPPCPPPSARSW